MKYSVLLVAFLLSFNTITTAQLQLPQASPAASVSQTVGLTDIQIEYSSPGVKSRTIFGGLLPYGEMWRTGANAATKISFSRDVTVEGTKIPKGKYALYTIPAKDAFTVIINKDINSSVDTYKKEEDIIRFQAKVQPCEFRERMTFLFSDFNESQATINLEWEKTRISFNVKTDTDAQAKESINAELGKTWRTYNSAARYFLDTKSDYETGMKYVEQSWKLKEDWQNAWTKAQLLKAMGKNADAHTWAVKAKELGDKSDNFFFKEQVSKAVAEWNQSPAKK
jgi:hypothetical protein